MHVEALAYFLLYRDSHWSRYIGTPRSVAGAFKRPDGQRIEQALTTFASLCVLCGRKWFAHSMDARKISSVLVVRVEQVGTAEKVKGCLFDTGISSLILLSKGHPIVPDFSGPRKADLLGEPLISSCVILGVPWRSWR